MKKILIAIIFILVFTISCTDNPGAYKTLSNNGYTNIELTGVNFLSCSKGDFYRTGFYAISPSGSSVNGTVCKGLLFKGSTIRFD